MKNNIKKDFVWNTAGSLVYSLTSLIFMILVTRIVGPKDAGVFTIAFTTASLLQTISNYAGRTYQVTENDKKITDSDYLYNRIVTCAVMLLLGIFYVLLKGYNLNKSLIVLSLAIFRCIDSLAEYLYAIIQKNNYLYKVGISLFLKAVIEDIVFLLVILVTKNVLYSCIALIIINVIITVFYDCYNVKKIGIKILSIDIEKVMSILKNGLWVFLSTFLLQYIFNASKYAIDSYMAEEFQTVFGIVIMPATFIYLLSMFIVQPYLVSIKNMVAKSDVKGLNKLVSKTTIILFAGGLACVGVAAIIGIPFLELIYNVELDSYKIDLLLIIFSAILYSCSYIIINILIAMRKTFIQTVSYLFISVVELVLSRILVQAYGVIGATIAYSVSMLLIFIIYGLLYLYYVKRQKVLY